MTGRIEARLKELGISVPDMASPVANYVPWVRTGALLFISGQITTGPKGLAYIGTVGGDLDVATGRAAARACAVNILGVLKSALDGDLDRVKRIVKLTGFVNAVPGFTDHSDVVNGASDLFVEIFGDIGRHARSSVGVASLPRDVPIEVEAVVEAA